ncbi:uncharacterized protein LOC128302784 [Anopheles moucheti]|uniref:uncharacterized protein LOC128302784 n=1 Tax=Anopheles moucheti TaxID=186751 RepID=UPI0022F0A33F|nr:uncharacterized protein LOC128302784 [Anopheles moucheti]
MTEMEVHGSQTTIRSSKDEFSTKSYNAVHGCLRCTCVGEYDHNGHKIVLDSVGAPLRTDAEFRSRVCVDHHQPWHTPLEDLVQFDIVEDVPTSDRLHLCDLGATRKWLYGIWDGKFLTIPQLTSSQRDLLTNFCTSLRLPSEINRKTLDPMYMHKWKGSQFRSFLHYGSVVVMEEILNSRAYNHLLLYFCALTIYSTEFHRQHWNRASIFLDTYVRDFGGIFGREHLTSNIHNLQHVARDVLRYGPLDSFSTYCFENYLGILKRSVRSGFKCGVQIAARSEERADHHSFVPCVPDNIPDVTLWTCDIPDTANLPLDRNFI